MYRVNEGEEAGGAHGLALREEADDGVLLHGPASLPIAVARYALLHHAAVPHDHPGCTRILAWAYHRPTGSQAGLDAEHHLHIIKCPSSLSLLAPV